MAVATAVVAGVAIAASAYSAHEQASAQKKAAKEAAKPKPYENTTTTTPYGPAVQYIPGLLTEAERMYSDPALRKGPPGLGKLPKLSDYMRGGGGGNIPGSSSRSSGILDDIYSRAQNDTSVDQATQQALAIGGGSAHPMMQGAYNAAQQSTTGDPYLDRYINEGFEGAGGAGNEYLRQYLDRAGASMAGGGGRAVSYSIPGGGGGGGGGVGPGDYENKLVTDEYARLIGGEYLDEGNPHIQAVMENIRRENEGNLNSSLQGLDARAMGAGRFGGGMYQNQSAMARAENAQDLTGQAAQLYAANYDAERTRMMEGLGLYQQRDIAQWGDETQRAALASQERAAGAAGAGAAASARSQEALERERMYLQAAGMLNEGDLGQRQLLGQGIQANLQNSQYGLGLMAQIGTEAGAQQLGAIGQIPELTQAGYYGLQTALQGSQQADAQNAAAAQARASAARANAQAQYEDAWRRQQVRDERKMQQWQFGVDRPRELFGDYLGTVTGIAQLGGTQHTQGYNTPNVAPYTGPSPTSAAIQAGLGTGLQLYGAGLGGGGGRMTQAGYAGMQSAPPPGMLPTQMAGATY